MYYIEHIDLKKCNNEYIKSVFILFFYLIILPINLTSITNVFFHNNNAYIYIYIYINIYKYIYFTN